MFVLVYPILTYPFAGSIALLQEMEGDKLDGAEVAKTIIAALMRCYPETTIVEFLGGVVTGIDAVISALRPSQEERQPSTVEIEEIVELKPTKQRPDPVCSGDPTPRRRADEEVTLGSRKRHQPSDWCRPNSRSRASPSPSRSAGDTRRRGSGRTATGGRSADPDLSEDTDR